MAIDVGDVLGFVAQCAGSVPFLILDGEGHAIHRSPGVARLEGLRFDFGGEPRSVSAEGLDGAPPPYLRKPRQNAKVHGTTSSGTVKTYLLQCHPLPVEAPELWMLRFDEESESPDGRGLPLERPKVGGDVVCFHGIWSRDPVMKELFDTIQRVAETDVTVLIRGESGTGKERVATALHELSPRRSGPFVAVNCAALSPGLLESELFGHVKGAFTGATRDRKGLFAQADKGTLFLDEIAEMPLELQTRLLRVIEQKTITPVGGSGETSVDVRILSATHRSLRAAVEAGSFRADLMYRLRIVPLYLPPLRDRRGDIELLLKLMLAEQSDAGRHTFESVAPEAMRALLDHAWDGNVRELRNVAEYAAVVGRGRRLDLSCLPPEFREAPSSFSRSRRPLTEDDERARIVAALETCDGHRGDAAELLGMHRTTLWRKLKQYGLD